MAMKKKLMSLAMAGAIVVPSATGVFADSDRKDIGITSGRSTQHSVIMDAKMVGHNGAAAGQVIVSVPTKMGFVMDNNGKVGQTGYEIINSSNDHKIKVGIDSLVESNPTGGIKIRDTQIADAANTPRNEVYLTLRGDREVNLGSMLNNAGGTQQLTVVEPKNSKQLILSGQGGTQQLTGSEEINGDTEGFTLMFRLEAEEVQNH